MNDKKKHVEDFLSKNGYPLEMYVAKQFSLAGFEVYQSSIYVDTETEKHRELDVAAYYFRMFNGIPFSFKVLIECKYSPTSWILFSGENHGFKTDSRTNFYGANYAGRKLLDRIAGVDGFVKSNPFVLSSNMGYGITEVRDNKQENMTNPYKAIMTLLGALEYEKDESRQVGRSFEIYIPVIVLQGNFFDCEINPVNDIVVTEINEGQVLYKNNVFPEVFPLIEVVTRERVPALAEKLFKDLNSITTTYYDDISNLIAKFPEKLGSVFL
jgi:hypothetical protein